jgi:hypothetical protein
MDNFLVCHRYTDGYEPWCKNCKKIHRKTYYEENKQKELEYQKNYSKQHTKEHSEWMKKYRKLYPEKVSKWKKSYRDRNKNNPTYRMNHSMGCNLRHALKRKKNSRHWETIVGYTTEDLIKHLESKFTEGMTWENYGKWHIDHIIPKSKFLFIDDMDPKFRQCWALSNLQPLWAEDNILKGTN